MKKFDYLTKELVNSFSFTTITKDREACADVMINGRTYTKWGKLQAVTMVGNVWRDTFGNTVMHVGIARQNPKDTLINKQISYEVAQDRSMNNPDIVINLVPEYLNEFNFGQMMSWYCDAMKLQFVKTKEEIQLVGDNPKNYDR